jgi:diaminopimelate epimerase
VCHRNLGIGADGMMIVSRNEENGMIKMLFFNQDGSQAPMCGNGVRCFSHYLYNKKLVQENVFQVDTLAGVMEISIFPEEIFNVKVNIGKAYLETEKIPMSIKKDRFINEKIDVVGQQVELSSLFLGTTHTVVFVDNLEETRVEKIGAALEKHELYPMKTNVNFCEIVSYNRVKLKTWERGVGVTFACGTGASATVFVGNLLGKLSDKTTVMLPYGELLIEINGDEVFMTGPSEKVAEGFYDY